MPLPPHVEISIKPIAHYTGSSAPSETYLVDSMALEISGCYDTLERAMENMKNAVIMVGGMKKLKDPEAADVVRIAIVVKLPK